MRDFALVLSAGVHTCRVSRYEHVSLVLIVIAVSHVAPQIVQRTETSFVRTGELDHPYPPTKIMWSPEKGHASTDLLATTGDSTITYAK